MGVRTKLWTRDEYERLITAGGFPPAARVQLIDGEIVEMTPQSPAHATVLLVLSQILSSAFREGHVVRTQLPLALGGLSEPEPDIAVVQGVPADYRDQHPSSAVLVVEVADTTLSFDRTRKLSMYAAAGISEYWIVNLVESVLEVYRDPLESSYRTSLRLAPAQAVAPLAAPAVQVQVSDLFV